MSEIQEIVNALSLLTPCELLSEKKVRIGNPSGDGGYVLADRFRAGQKVYSYGLSTELTFDRTLAERGLQIYMYDHTIDGLVSNHPNFHFFRQGIASADIPEESLFSLDYHLRFNNHVDDDMILKMDVEGAEWDVFDQIDPSILRRFEQIALEIHGIPEIENEEFRSKFVRVLKKVTANFNIIHVHSNNFLPIPEVARLRVPLLMEITFLRKGLGDVGPWRTFIPSRLDVPNVKGPDHVLDFFPFLPWGLSLEEFRSGLAEACQRASELAERWQVAIETRGENIARGGLCSQSSLSPWSKGKDEASQALRDTKDGQFAFHTDIEDSPWWQIDLGSVRTFDEIICFNRLDACSERARNLVVELSENGTDWWAIHRNTDVFGGADGRPLRVVSPRMSSRYVRLRLPEHTALHLDGVEIYSWDSTG